ncbi:hypothetical protein EVAR_93177_1 [Eumeta japonica]|uniref:Uncharacterized protein n=1 Tax=Eumeta variegata TaxID=151549 RepID=A0A4C1TI18_EUMVA|nr:hypothetical protein EVAR_93177_1 [Eumeta japonica]
MRYDRTGGGRAPSPPVFCERVRVKSTPPGRYSISGQIRPLPIAGYTNYSRRRILCSRLFKPSASPAPTPYNLNRRSETRRIELVVIRFASRRISPLEIYVVFPQSYGSAVIVDEIGARPDVRAGRWSRPTAAKCTCRTVKREPTPRETEKGRGLSRSPTRQKGTADDHGIREADAKTIGISCRPGVITGPGPNS